MKIRDLVLSTLNENNNSFLYLNRDVLNEVKDITLDKTKNTIVIFLETSYGKVVKLETETKDFKKWLANNKVKTRSTNTFLEYAKEFIGDSKLNTAEDLNEIIDQNGVIAPDFGEVDGQPVNMPNNATNSMIGTDNVEDLERRGRKAVQKASIRMSGNLGVGSITW